MAESSSFKAKDSPWYAVRDTAADHWRFSLPREDAQFRAALENGSLRSATHLRIDLRSTKKLLDGLLGVLGELEAPGLVALDLDIVHQDVQSESFVHLLRAPFVAHLESLRLCAWLKPGHVRLLVDESRFERLRRLVLEAVRFDESSVQSIAAAPRLATLTELALCGATESAPLAPAIRTSPYLTQLEHLTLKPVGDEGLRSLLELEPLVATVRQLDLEHGGIPEQHAIRDAVSDLARLTWPRLQRLRLDSNLVRDDGARSLARSTGLRGLTHLSLATCRMTEVGLCAIAESLAFPELTSLGLRNNSQRFWDRSQSLSAATTERRSPVGAESVDAFLRSTGYPKLERLDLSDCGVPRDGRTRLLGRPNLPGLRWVDVTSNEYE